VEVEGCYKSELLGNGGESLKESYGRSGSAAVEGYAKNYVLEK
jgi:hypothetical protein